MADTSMHRFSKIFGDFANVVARAAGRASAFVLAVAVIIVWAATGPVFQFSDTWQLIINTGTTIVTFLMVFLIQNSQNRDSAAIQVKLDELIRVGEVQNRFVGIEHLTEEEIEELRRKCEARAQKGGSNAVRRIDQRARRAADKEA
jgi:low affinity Fe/Cu permease